jgi:hypothetical protein
MPGTHPELRNTRPPGRPTLLNEQVKSRLLDALKLGVPIRTAAEHAGIHVNTFGRWMARGYSEHEARAQGKEPLEEETPFLDLYLAAQEAQSEAKLRNVGLVQKAAQGGYVTKETTKKYRDVETGQVVTETLVEKAPPDWRAAAWWLERAAKDEFGKDAVQVQVSGAGGGPVQVNSSLEDLSKKLAEHLAGNAAIAAITAGEAGDEDDPDTVDADVVEDTTA